MPRADFTTKMLGPHERHHPNSRRILCSCGESHAHWGEYIDAKGRLQPDHEIVCKCGITHRRY